jgi:hypothetical protein
MSETASAKNEQIRIRPTIIIGMGGTGGDVIMRVRRRFYETYGSLAEFPIVSYLWLDTDRSEKHILAKEIRDFVRLTDTERLMLTINDTTSITQNLKEPNYAHVDKWWYPGLNALGQMNEGAGQIRAYSRLAFFHHYQAIRTAIIDANTKVRDPLAQDVMMKSPVLKDLGLLAQVDFNSPTNVVLVCSIAGGTGSGMMMDVSFLVKEIFQEGNVTTCAYLVFPDHFGTVTNERMKANSYALLKELNHYQYGVPHFEAEWNRGNNLKVAIPPFDYCYIFDNQNAAGQVSGGQPGSQNLIFELLADSIFKDFAQGEFADHKRSARINLKQYMNKTFDYEHPRFKQRFIQRYGSLGMSSIQVPHARIITACAYKLAAEVVDRWGGLSATQFNDADLPRFVSEDVLPKLRLVENDSTHDILFALLDAGGTADPDKGKARGLLDELNSWRQNKLIEVERGVHRQKNQNLRDWLDAAFKDQEKELLAEQVSNQTEQWGKFPRTIRANLEALLTRAQERMQKHIFELVDQKGQSLRYTEALLRELGQSLSKTISYFESKLVDLQDHLVKRQKLMQKRLTEIARQQNRTNWDGRSGIIHKYLAERYFECLVGDTANPGLLRCLIQDRLYKDGIEFCKRLQPVIVGQQRADGSRTGGMQTQLAQLGRDLEQLRQDLLVGYGYFSQKEDLPHALVLYETTDIEKKFYPAFVTPQVVEEVSKAALARLERTVTGLSVDLAAGKSDSWKRALLAEGRQKFWGIKHDFHVLRVLFKDLDDTTRVNHLRQIYSRSAYWATRSGIHGTFRLPPEQVHIMVGIPGATPGMDPGLRSELEGYSSQLKQIVGRELKGDVNFYPVPEGSELIFYQEAGGFPLNYCARMADLRESYLKLYTAGEPLHIDCRDKKFGDLMILTQEERQSLEEAYECHLLGCLFDILEFRAGEYLWMEKDGFQMRPHPLGDTFMLRLKLSTHEPTRQKLMTILRDRRGALLSSQNEEDIARYAAILEWYKQDAWGDSWGKKTDESELPFEQMMTIRVVKSELDAIADTPLVRKLGNDKFGELVQAAYEQRDQIFKARPDGKLALIKR